jgi:hypothetical protein
MLERFKNDGFNFPNPESRIPNPESRIPNPESRIPNPESRIPNPESRIPKKVAESIAKPGSVLFRATAIPLGFASLQNSSSAPACESSQFIARLFGLAPSGVCRALWR